MKCRIPSCRVALVLGALSLALACSDKESSFGPEPSSEGGSQGMAEAGAPDAGEALEAPGGPLYLKASNAGAGDLFGVAMALSADGNTLAVGASREASAATGVDGDQADDSAKEAGAVYIFQREEGVWEQTAYLKASNAEGGDMFGSAVALSADGSTLAVGAPFEASAATGVDGDASDNSASDTGAAYVFARGPSGWEQQAYVKASYVSEGSFFGISLSLSADGDVLAVGAQGEPSAATGVDPEPGEPLAYGAGAVYTFTRANDGWTPTAYLKASNPDAGDEFGGTVALSGDGRWLAVGAYWEDSVANGVDGDPMDNSAPRTGAVYVFSQREGEWQQQAYLKPPANGGVGDDNFGTAVSLSGDGQVLLVGAPGDASAASGVDGDSSDTSAPYAGAAYVIERAGETWSYAAYLKASNSGVGDEFGFRVALAADGKSALVGAALEDSVLRDTGAAQGDDSASESGAAYLFRVAESTWSQRAYIKATKPGIGDRFGWSLSLSGDGSWVAVGADREASSSTGLGGDLDDNATPEAGAAYLYEGLLGD